MPIQPGEAIYWIDECAPMEGNGVYGVSTVLRNKMTTEKPIEYDLQQAHYLLQAYEAYILGAEGKYQHVFYAGSPLQDRIKKRIPATPESPLHAVILKTNPPVEMTVGVALDLGLPLKHRAPQVIADERDVFTPEEVVRLNDYQRAGVFHPFTCGSGNRTDARHGDGEGVLIATTRGWICPFCDYTQNWAHDFMKAYDRAGKS